MQIISQTHHFVLVKKPCFYHCLVRHTKGLVNPKVIQETLAAILIGKS